MASFVHLHVHSEFSLLDGLANLSDLCQYALESGMTALALTDHGGMYGTIKFQRAAAHAGIKPIYGCEVYQAPRKLTQKDAKLDNKPYHLILLAKNLTGYHNLLQLVTTANLDGLYYKPRIDKDLLAAHAEGLICLSACIAGEVPALLDNGQADRARETVSWFREVFGADNYFLELQQHRGVPQLAKINPQLVSLAKSFGLRCAATNDVHYVRRSDASAHELLLAIQTQTTLSNPKRMQMGSDDYYLLTPDEMAATMPEYPEALENTLLIAEQCNVDLGFQGYHLPRFEVPELYPDAEAYLRAQCEAGLRRRYAEITPEIEQRLYYELGVIHKMGFDDYFLITADLVNWAKNSAKMLVGPGRGSGGGSLVAYTLGITDLEPLGLGLIFERFLNPGRVNMPDIDLDYPEDRRQEVIDYLTRRYGEDKTAQIATFGTMAARGAVRDVGRALDVPLSDVDYVAKLIPSGPKKTIADGLELPELKQLYETKPYVKQLIDYALAVQGRARNLSTHAAGVLIGDRPLVEYSPLQRAPRSEGIISQFCMEDVEAIGLLKIDILGLSTLTVLDRAFRWIERTNGITLTQASIPMDDSEAFALLCSGEVTGIFQVESAGMRRTLREMQPTEFKEIVAVLALYRPGPMTFIPNYIARKFGREDLTYHHPALEPILAETYGIIVYQEQIIKIASELAGYTPAEADLMRRAVGKKKKKDLELQHAKFVAGAAQHGVPTEAAEAIFADIELFADYGFNKSHGAAYAVITLQTAYLKAHYPVEFMTALLSVERGNLEKVAELIAECRRLGVEVRPPDINASDLDFRIEPATPQPGKERDQLLGIKDLAIRFGLGAIKNVGDGPAKVIVEGRGDVPFADVDDFVRRVDLRQLNKRVLECLIRAGAMDCLAQRHTLLAALDQMMADSQQTHKAKEIGQRSLFDISPNLMVASAHGTFALPKDVPGLAEKKRLADEKELLGVYMSSHPLEALSQYVDDRLTSLSNLDPDMDKQAVQVAGMINSLRVIATKKGDQMAFAQLEDLSGTVELTIFPRTYEDTKELLSGDTLLLVQAKVDIRDEAVKLVVDAIEPYKVPANARRRQPTRKKAKYLLVEIPLGQDERRDIRVVEQVFAILTENRGDTPFSFQLRDRYSRVEMSFPDLLTAYSPQVEQQVVALVGPGCLTVEWA